MSKILQGYPRPKDNQYKVYVCSITYNQAPYIADCLNGVAMQQTDFPFIHHVIDDKSTDGEVEVIEQWLNDNCKMDEATYYDSELSNTIMVSHKTNSNYTIVVDFLKNNMYRNPRKEELFKLWRENCLYEALCEGDDYWIYPLKLQKQVEWMDLHMECSMCFSNAINRYDDDINQNSLFNKATSSRFVDLEDIVFQWIIPTASILIRLDVLDNYPEWKNEIYSGDQTLALIAFSKGKIYGVKDVMTVYRKFAVSSISEKLKRDSSKNAFVQKEHLKLYTYYNIYTGHKYNNMINKKIIQLKSQISFIENSKYGLLYAIISNPRFMISWIRRHIFKLKY